MPRHEVPGRNVEELEKRYVRLSGNGKVDRRMLRYDALSVNEVPPPMSRGLCPARGPWEDPARDGKSKR